MIGPVAATLLSSAVSTAFPLVASAGVTVAGTAWFLLGAGTLRPRIAQKKAVFGSVLLNRAVMLAMVASLGLVASFMALEVGIVAAMGDDGVTAGSRSHSPASAHSSGPGIRASTPRGRRRRRGPDPRGVGIVLFAVFDNRVLQFASLFLSGLGFAPALSALYIMVSREIEEHVATEAFGWLNSAMFVGGAIGTALAGVATEAHGFMGAVVVAALLAGSPP